MYATKSKEKTISDKEPTAAQGVSITYYTDPLCCWCWVFESEWQMLLHNFQPNIVYRYCMAGLIPDWKNYHDELLSVTRPLQMGPVWMQAAHLSGKEIYDRIWMEDPPASSYPACIAVKCAELQSFQAGEMYLQLCREAVMMKGINIAKENALINIAEQLADTVGLINVKQFKEDLINEKGMDAFKKDLQEVQYRRINRFPALVIHQPDKKPIISVGYKPYEALEKLMTTQ